MLFFSTCTVKALMKTQKRFADDPAVWRQEVNVYGSRIGKLLSVIRRSLFLEHESQKRKAFIKFADNLLENDKMLDEKAFLKGS